MISDCISVRSDVLVAARYDQSVAVGASLAAVDFHSFHSPVVEHAPRTNWMEFIMVAALQSILACWTSFLWESIRGCRRCRRRQRRRRENERINRHMPNGKHFSPRRQRTHRAQNVHHAYTLFASSAAYIFARSVFFFYFIDSLTLFFPFSASPLSRRDTIFHRARSAPNNQLQIFCREIK